MNEMPQRIVRPFTPSLLNDQEFKVYEPELKEVFRVDGITNVAISGPFGAGKTSVMSTWEASKEGSSHKYLHLSLRTSKAPISQTMTRALPRATSRRCSSTSLCTR